MKKTLNPFFPGIVDYDQTGVLIVTDVQSNISRLSKTIKAIDVVDTGEEAIVIPLKHANAKTMAPKLKTIFNAITSEAGEKISSTASQIKIWPDDRTNSLIIKASEVDTPKIKELINRLDVDAKDELFLQNDDAEKLGKRNAGENVLRNTTNEKIKKDLDYDDGNINLQSSPKIPPMVSMDFDNVDIMYLINFISDLTKKNFIVDDKVRGKVTVISPTRVTIDEAYRTFESVLEVHGYTTVPSGSAIKIVKRKNND